MGKDHRIDEAKTSSQGRRQQSGKPGQSIGGKKDASKSGEVGAKAHIKPKHHHALKHKSAGKGIQRKKGRQPEYDGVGAVKAQECLARRSKTGMIFLWQFGSKREPRKEHRKR